MFHEWSVHSSSRHSGSVSDPFRTVLTTLCLLTHTESGDPAKRDAECQARVLAQINTQPTTGRAKSEQSAPLSLGYLRFVLVYSLVCACHPERPLASNKSTREKRVPQPLEQCSQLGHTELMYREHLGSHRFIFKFSKPNGVIHEEWQLEPLHVKTQSCCTLFLLHA